MKIKLPKSFSKISFKKAPALIESEPKPKRDWKIMVCFFAVASLFVASGSYYFYFQIENGKLFPLFELPEVPIQVINKKSVGEIVKSFEDRKAKVSEIMGNAKIFVDPSL